jgi:hypothetical protein
VTEINAERIEGVSEDARHGEQPDWPARFYTGFIKMTDDPVAWRLRPLAVVPIMEAENVETVVREKAKFPRQHVYFVEIEQQVENTVAQAMLPWPQPVMHHGTSIQP